MKIIEEPAGIFFFHPAYPIVIPTNTQLNKAGHSIMGVGVARQMKDRYPEFPKCVGNSPKKVEYWGHYNAITFPTKRHWRENSTLRLIEENLLALNELVDAIHLNNIYLPKLGCGFGGLSWFGQVLPLLEKYLDDRFSAVL